MQRAWDEWGLPRVADVLDGGDNDGDEDDNSIVASAVGTTTTNNNATAALRQRAFAFALAHSSAAIDDETRVSLAGAASQHAAQYAAYLHASLRARRSSVERAFAAQARRLQRALAAATHLRARTRDALDAFVAVAQHDDDDGGGGVTASLLPMLVCALASPHEGDAARGYGAMVDALLDSVQRVLERGDCSAAMATHLLRALREHVDEARCAVDDDAGVQRRSRLLAAKWALALRSGSVTAMVQCMLLPHARDALVGNGAAALLSLAENSASAAAVHDVRRARIDDYLTRTCAPPALERATCVSCVPVTAMTTAMPRDGLRHERSMGTGDDETTTGSARMLVACDSGAAVLYETLGIMGTRLRAVTSATASWCTRGCVVLSCRLDAHTRRAHVTTIAPAAPTATRHGRDTFVLRERVLRLDGGAASLALDDEQHDAARARIRVDASALPGVPVRATYRFALHRRNDDDDKGTLACVLCCPAATPARCRCYAIFASLDDVYRRCSRQGSEHKDDDDNEVYTLRVTHADVLLRNVDGAVAADVGDGNKGDGTRAATTTTTPPRALFFVATSHLAVGRVTLKAQYHTFCLEAWVCPRGVGDVRRVLSLGDKAIDEVVLEVGVGHDGVLWRGGARTPQLGFSCVSYTAAGKLSMATATAAMTTAASAAAAVGATTSSTKIAASGRWWHVALNFTGATWELYLDGHLAARQRATVAPAAIADAACVLGRGFVGCVAEVRVWQRTRTASELLRDAHRPLRGDEAGLCAYMPLSEGYGEVVHDIACACGAYNNNTNDKDDNNENMQQQQQQQQCSSAASAFVACRCNKEHGVLTHANAPRWCAVPHMPVVVTTATTTALSSASIACAMPRLRADVMPLTLLDSDGGNDVYAALTSRHLVVGTTCKSAAVALYVYARTRRVLVSQLHIDVPQTWRLAGVAAQQQQQSSSSSGDNNNSDDDERLLCWSTSREHAGRLTLWDVYATTTATPLPTTTSTAAAAGAATKAAALPRGQGAPVHASVYARGRAALVHLAAFAQRLLRAEAYMADLSLAVAHAPARVVEATPQLPSLLLQLAHAAMMPQHPQSPQQQQQQQQQQHKSSSNTRADRGGGAGNVDEVLVRSVCVLLHVNLYTRYAAGLSWQHDDVSVPHTATTTLPAALATATTSTRTRDAVNDDDARTTAAVGVLPDKNDTAVAQRVHTLPAAVLQLLHDVSHNALLSLALSPYARDTGLLRLCCVVMLRERDRVRLLRACAARPRDGAEEQLFACLLDEYSTLQACNDVLQPARRGGRRRRRRRTPRQRCAHATMLYTALLDEAAHQLQGCFALTTQQQQQQQQPSTRERSSSNKRSRTPPTTAAAAPAQGHVASARLQHVCHALEVLQEMMLARAIVTAQHAHRNTNDEDDDDGVRGARASLSLQRAQTQWQWSSSTFVVVDDDGNRHRRGALDSDANAAVVAATNDDDGAHVLLVLDYCKAVLRACTRAIDATAQTLRQLARTRGIGKDTTPMQQQQQQMVEQRDRHFVLHCLRASPVGAVLPSLTASLPLLPPRVLASCTRLLQQCREALTTLTAVLGTHSVRRAGAATEAAAVTGDDDVSNNNKKSSSSSAMHSWHNKDEATVWVAQLGTALTFSLCLVGCALLHADAAGDVVVDGDDDDDDDDENKSTRRSNRSGKRDIVHDEVALHGIDGDVDDGECGSGDARRQRDDEAAVWQALQDDDDDDGGGGAVAATWTTLQLPRRFVALLKGGQRHGHHADERDVLLRQLQQGTGPAAVAFAQLQRGDRAAALLLQRDAQLQRAERLVVTAFCALVVPTATLRDGRADATVLLVYRHVQKVRATMLLRRQQGGRALRDLMRRAAFLSRFEACCNVVDAADERSYNSNSNNNGSDNGNGGGRNTTRSGGAAAAAAVTTTTTTWWRRATGGGGSGTHDVLRARALVAQQQQQHQQWRTFFRAWKAMRRLRTLAIAHADTSVERVCGDVATFLQSDCPPAALDAYVRQRTRTAQYRLVGLLLLRQLCVEAQHSAALARLLLPTMAKALCEWHEASGVECCASDMRARLRNAYVQLVDVVLTTLRASLTTTTATATTAATTAAAGDNGATTAAVAVTGGAGGTIAPPAALLTSSLSWQPWMLLLVSLLTSPLRARDVCSLHDSAVTVLCAAQQAQYALTMSAMSSSAAGSAGGAWAMTAAAAATLTGRDGHSRVPAELRATTLHGSVTAASLVVGARTGLTLRACGERGTCVVPCVWRHYAVSSSSSSTTTMHRRNNNNNMTTATTAHAQRARHGDVYDAAAAASGVQGDGCCCYYYEVHIIDLLPEAMCSVGVGDADYRPSRLPGLEAHSYALQSDGALLCGSATTARLTGYSCHAGDVVGCGWHVAKAEVYWTRNGSVVVSTPLTTTATAAATATTTAATVTELCPLIGFVGRGTVRVNFGATPFVFDCASVLTITATTTATTATTTAHGDDDHTRQRRGGSRGGVGVPLLRDGSEAHTLRVLCADAWDAFTILSVRTALCLRRVCRRRARQGRSNAIVAAAAPAAAVTRIDGDDTTTLHSLSVCVGHCLRALAAELARVLQQTANNNSNSNNSSDAGEDARRRVCVLLCHGSLLARLLSRVPHRLLCAHAEVLARVLQSAALSPSLSRNAPHELLLTTWSHVMHLVPPPPSRPTAAVAVAATSTDTAAAAATATAAAATTTVRRRSNNNDGSVEDDGGAAVLCSEHSAFLLTLLRLAGGLCVSAARATTTGQRERGTGAQGGGSNNNGNGSRGLSRSGVCSSHGAAAAAAHTTTTTTAAAAAMRTHVSLVGDCDMLHESCWVALALLQRIHTSGRHTGDNNNKSDSSNIVSTKSDEGDDGDSEAHAWQGVLHEWLCCVLRHAQQPSYHVQLALRIASAAPRLAVPGDVVTVAQRAGHCAASHAVLLSYTLSEGVCEVMCTSEAPATRETTATAAAAVADTTASLGDKDTAHDDSSDSDSDDVQQQQQLLRHAAAAAATTYLTLPLRHVSLLVHPCDSRSVDDDDHDGDGDDDDDGDDENKKAKSSTTSSLFPRPHDARHAAQAHELLAFATRLLLPSSTQHNSNNNNNSNSAAAATEWMTVRAHAVLLLWRCVVRRVLTLPPSLVTALVALSEQMEQHETATTTATPPRPPCATLTQLHVESVALDSCLAAATMTAALTTTTTTLSAAANNTAQRLSSLAAATTMSRQQHQHNINRSRIRRHRRRHRTHAPMPTRHNTRDDATSHTTADVLLSSSSSSSLLSTRSRTLRVDDDDNAQRRLRRQRRAELNEDDNGNSVQQQQQQEDDEEEEQQQRQQQRQWQRHARRLLQHEQRQRHRLQRQQQLLPLLPPAPHTLLSNTAAYYEHVLLAGRIHALTHHHRRELHNVLSLTPSLQHIGTPRALYTHDVVSANDGSNDDDDGDEDRRVAQLPRPRMHSNNSDSSHDDDMDEDSDAMTATLPDVDDDSSSSSSSNSIISVSEATNNDERPVNVTRDDDDMDDDDEESAEENDMYEDVDVHDDDDNNNNDDNDDEDDSSSNHHHHHNSNSNSSSSSSASMNEEQMMMAELDLLRAHYPAYTQRDVVRSLTQSDDDDDDEEGVGRSAAHTPYDDDEEDSDDVNDDDDEDDEDDVYNNDNSANDDDEDDDSDEDRALLGLPRRDARDEAALQQQQQRRQQRRRQQGQRHVDSHRRRRRTRNNSNGSGDDGGGSSDDEDNDDNDDDDTDTLHFARGCLRVVASQPVGCNYTIDMHVRIADVRRRQVLFVQRCGTLPLPGSHHSSSNSNNNSNNNSDSHALRHATRFYAELFRSYYVTSTTTSNNTTSSRSRQHNHHDNGSSSNDDEDDDDEVDEVVRQRERQLALSLLPMFAPAIVARVGDGVLEFGWALDATADVTAAQAVQTPPSCDRLPDEADRQRTTTTTTMTTSQQQQQQQPQQQQLLQQSLSPSRTPRGHVLPALPYMCRAALTASDAGQWLRFAFVQCGTSLFLYKSGVLQDSRCVPSSTSPSPSPSLASTTTTAPSPRWLQQQQQQQQQTTALSGAMVQLQLPRVYAERLMLLPSSSSPPPPAPSTRHEGGDTQQQRQQQEEEGAAAAEQTMSTVTVVLKPPMLLLDEWLLGNSSDNVDNNNNSNSDDAAVGARGSDAFGGEVRALHVYDVALRGVLIEQLHLRGEAAVSAFAEMHVALALRATRSFFVNAARSSSALLTSVTATGHVCGVTSLPLLSTSQTQTHDADGGAASAALHDPLARAAGIDGNNSGSSRGARAFAREHDVRSDVEAAQPHTLDTSAAWAVSTQYMALLRKHRTCSYDQLLDQRTRCARQLLRVYCAFALAELLRQRGDAVDDDDVCDVAGAAATLSSSSPLLSQWATMTTAMTANAAAYIARVAVSLRSRYLCRVVTAALQRAARHCARCHHPHARTHIRGSGSSSSNVCMRDALMHAALRSLLSVAQQPQGMRVCESSHPQRHAGKAVWHALHVPHRDYYEVYVDARSAATTGLRLTFAADRALSLVLAHIPAYAASGALRAHTRRLYMMCQCNNNNNSSSSNASVTQWGYRVVVVYDCLAQRCAMQLFRRVLSAHIVTATGNNNNSSAAVVTPQHVPVCRAVNALTALSSAAAVTAMTASDTNSSNSNNSSNNSGTGVAFVYSDECVAMLAECVKVNTSTTRRLALACITDCLLHLHSPQPTSSSSSSSLLLQPSLTACVQTMQHMADRLCRVLSASSGATATAAAAALSPGDVVVHSRFVQLVTELYTVYTDMLRCSSGRGGGSDNGAAAAAAVQPLATVTTTTTRVATSLQQQPQQGLLARTLPPALPCNHMRAFADLAAHLLTTGRHALPPFVHDEVNPFAHSRDRRGPAHVSLHAPDTVLVRLLEATNTGVGFDTVVADCAVRAGAWYYEVTLRTQGVMQIGWLRTDSRPDGAGDEDAAAAGATPYHDSVGDTTTSWSVDMMRRVRWHAGVSDAITSVPRRWVAGDVVGCALDLTRRTMLFTLNGRPLTCGSHRSGGGGGSGSSNSRSGTSMATMSAAAAAASLSLHLSSDAGNTTATPDTAAATTPAAVTAAVTAAQAANFAEHAVSAPTMATFSDVPSDGGDYVPALTLRAGNGVSVNFGSTPFRYKPDGFAALGVSDSWCQRMDAHYASESSNDTARRHGVLRELWQAYYHDNSHSSSSSSHSDAVRAGLTVPPVYRSIAAAVDAYCEDTGKHYSQITEPALHAYMAKQASASARDEAGDAASASARAQTWQQLAALGALTRVAQTVLPFVHVHSRGPAQMRVLTPLLLGVRGVLFRGTRHALVDALLRETSVRTESRRVFVNRSKARAQPTVLSSSVFGQTLALLAHAPARMWRSSRRLWSTTFLGEGAEDAGGPYREHLYEMCRELMSSLRMLFVPTANHEHNTGTCREACVPAAAAVDAHARAAFALVGKLMGAALRSEEPLSLTFPPLVWRYLARGTLVEADLHAVDVIFVQCLRELRALCGPPPAATRRQERRRRRAHTRQPSRHDDKNEGGGSAAGDGHARGAATLSSSSSSHKSHDTDNNGDDKDNGNNNDNDEEDASCDVDAEEEAAARAAFDDVFDTQYFVTRLCDHSIVELVPGGAAVRVTYDRRAEYAAALLQARLHEFDVQLEAMRAGMLCVVPELALLLLTPEELERRVCGQADYTVEELRRTTVYEGLAADDRRVALLWRALAEATPTQRRLFLRFVAGRDRLPVKLRVLPYSTDLDADRAFPRATTCFFAIELPDYSTLAVMKQRLYYSIENCIDMDADFNARATDEHEGPHLTVGTDDGNLDDIANVTLQES